MEALRKSFTEKGFSNVQTYLQSGNIVFDSKIKDVKKLETVIRDLIEKEFKLNISVLVFSADELKDIAVKNPFLKDKTKNFSFLHITILTGVADESDIEKIKQNNYQNDEFIVKEKTIYLYCPNGYGNSKLTNNFWENKLKLTTTTRNCKTIKELINIAFNREEC